MKKSKKTLEKENYKLQKKLDQKVIFGYLLVSMTFNVIVLTTLDSFSNRLLLTFSNPSWFFVSISAITSYAPKVKYALADN